LASGFRKNEGFEPFSVVINVDDKECPKLFELIKGAENPYHNKLEKEITVYLQKMFVLTNILIDYDEKGR
jgi:hypothetical protein